MRSRTCSRLAVVHVLGSALVAFSGSAEAGPAAAPAAIAAAPATASPCRAAGPATSGRLTLNPPQAPPGAPVLAVITGLERFPEQVVGAGSGEHFMFCFGSPRADPLAPGSGGLADLVVVPLTVPTDAAIGQRQVEAAFSEGTGGFSAPEEDRVRLTADFEVAAGPVPLRPRDPDTPPCGATTRTPASGTLEVSPSRTTAGGAVRVRVTDPPPGLAATSGLGGHYVVCLLGNAVISPRVDVQGADAPSPPLDLTIPVPAGTPPGTHDVRVLALTGPAWVGWRQPLAVVGADRAPRVPVGGVDAGGGALAPPSRSLGLPEATLAAVLTLLAAVVVRRRRAG